MHVKKLGGLAPIELNGFLDDYKVRDAQANSSIIPVRAPSLNERRQNMINYKNEKNVLQLNDLVFLDTKETAFSKQYTAKVSSQHLFYIFSHLCFGQKLLYIFFLNPNLYVFLRNTYTVYMNHIPLQVFGKTAQTTIFYFQIQTFTFLPVIHKYVYGPS